MANNNYCNVSMLLTFIKIVKKLKINLFDYLMFSSLTFFKLFLAINTINKTNVYHIYLSISKFNRSFSATFSLFILKLKHSVNMNMTLQVTFQDLPFQLLPFL